MIATEDSVMPEVLGTLIGFGFCALVIGVVVYLVRRGKQKKAIAQGGEPRAPKTPEERKKLSKSLWGFGIAAIVMGFLVGKVFGPDTRGEAVADKLTTVIFCLIGVVLMTLAGLQDYKVWKEKQGSANVPPGQPTSADDSAEDSPESG